MPYSGAVFAHPEPHAECPGDAFSARGRQRLEAGAGSRGGGRQEGGQRVRGSGVEMQPK